MGCYIWYIKEGTGQGRNVAVKWLIEQLIFVTQVQRRTVSDVIVFDATDAQSLHGINHPKDAWVNVRTRCADVDS